MEYNVIECSVQEYYDKMKEIYGGKIVRKDDPIKLKLGIVDGNNWYKAKLVSCRNSGLDFSQFFNDK